MENNTDINQHIIYIAGLIHKVREREDLSALERSELEAWQQADPANKKLFEQLQDRVYLEEEVRATLRVDYLDSANELYEKLGIGTLAGGRRAVGYRYWLSAAAVLFLLCVGIWLWIRPSAPQGVVEKRPLAIRGDVAPGKVGAILTLADGSKVVLDSMGNGVVATQSGSKVFLDNGQLAYSRGQSGGAPVYNMMTTPKGRQFRLVLPDGTKVWLDAASSLRYPTVFTDKERKVEVMGEAYFEVAEDAKRPFRVKVNEETEIEVLGTDFNINAYQDEDNIKTTLLEGSVKVVRGKKDVLLKPGQQAQVNNLSAGASAGKDINVVSNVNVGKVMAWKNGVFDFQDATLEEVMRQLQRWYDIDVVYEKGIPKLEFIGKMERGLPLSAVLSGLEASKVHFRLEEGRRLVVLP